MPEAPAPAAQPAASRVPYAAWAAWTLGAIALALAVFLPPGDVAWLRREIEPLSRALSWTDHVSHDIDLLHVALFAWFAACGAWIRGRARLARYAVVLLVLAAGSELAQFFVPGRTPSLDDFAGDLLGIVAGFAFVGVLAFVRRAPRG